MKNARPQEKGTSAGTRCNPIPPRLTGQAVQQPSHLALMEELPPRAWPHGFKPQKGKRTLLAMWPDGSMGTGTVPASIGRLGLPYIMMAYDLAPLYDIARAVLERDWGKHKC